jgi:predicted MPP superfamily phosphohydrolase
MPQEAKGRSARTVARLRWGLAFVLLFVIWSSILRWALQPLHLQGIGQPLIGYLNGLDHLLQIPGAVIVRLLGYYIPHHPSPFDWLVVRAATLPIVFWLGYRSRTLWDWAKVAPTPPLPSGGLLSRRRLLLTGLTLGGAAATTFAYALLVEPRWFRITRRTFPIRGLPASLAGLRIVQITDVHHGPWLPLACVRHVVDAANALEPDLIFLTGDYVLSSDVYIQPAIAELARLRPKIATLAILGNHDWWEGPKLTRQELTKAGFVLLENARRVLTPDRRLIEAADEGLALAGVEDLWEGKPHYQRALGGLPDDMPRLLLSHNPDVAEELAFVQSGFRVDLMMSGHTHGGQIYLPGMGTPIVPSSYGQKYAQGLVQGPACPVFVCRGLGMSILPLRLGVPPEVAVLELVPQ